MNNIGGPFGVDLNPLSNAKKLPPPPTVKENQAAFTTVNSNNVLTKQDEFVRKPSGVLLVGVQKGINKTEKGANKDAWGGFGVTSIENAGESNLSDELNLLNINTTTKGEVAFNPASKEEQSAVIQELVGSMNESVSSASSAQLILSFINGLA